MKNGPFPILIRGLARGKKSMCAPVAPSGYGEKPPLWISVLPVLKGAKGLPVVCRARTQTTTASKSAKPVGTGLLGSVLLLTSVQLALLKDGGSAVHYPSHIQMTVLSGFVIGATDVRSSSAAWGCAQHVQSNLPKNPVP